MRVEQANDEKALRDELLEHTYKMLSLAFTDYKNVFRSTSVMADDDEDDDELYRQRHGE